MPTYQITSPSGKKISVTGPTPPNESELDAIFAKAAPQNIPASAIEIPNPTGIGPSTINPVQVGQTVKNMGLEGGGAAVGQILGAPFAEFGGVQAGGAIGGGLGNVLGQLTTPGKSFSPGEALAAATAGAIPGAPLANATAKTMAQQAAKYAGANVIGANLQSLVDTGAPASAGQDLIAGGAGALSPFLGKALDRGNRATAAANALGESAPMRGVLRDAKELGMVVPPVVSNPTLGNKISHVIAGGTDVVNAAKTVNGPAVVKAIREELGFVPGQAMDMKTLNAKAVGTNFVWDKIANVSPEASAAMSQFKELNAKANAAWRAYDGSQIKMPEQQATARALSDQADSAADMLRSALKDNGQEHLWDEFQNARKLRAQIELTKEAISPGGKINPDVFGNALENGRVLSGNLEKIGRVQSEFSKYVTENPATPSGNIFGGVTKLGAGALAGYAAGGIPGAAVGALTIPPIARKALLGEVGQAHFAPPTSGLNAPDFTAQVAKYGTASVPRAADVGNEPLTPEEMAQLEALRAKAATPPTEEQKPKKKIKLTNVKRDDNGHIVEGEVEINN